jgi:hypothetical protein
MPKPGNDTISKKFTSYKVLVHYWQTFSEAGFKSNQKAHRVTNFFNESQFGFRAHHITTLQCMRLTDIVALKFQ